MFYQNPVRTPGVVVSRSEYEKRGGFLPGLVHTADWEMWVRIIQNSKGLFINKPLATYRQFPGNDTGLLSKTGENIYDYLRLADVLQMHKNYDRKKMEQRALSELRVQIEKFKCLNDLNAIKYNRHKYYQILGNQPFLYRAMEFLRYGCFLLNHIAKKTCKINSTSDRDRGI